MSDVAVGTQDLELRLTSVGRVTLQLIDAETGSPVTPDVRDSHAIRVVATESEPYLRVDESAEGAGVLVGKLPWSEARSSVELEIRLPFTGFMKATATAVPVTREADEPQPIEVLLERGVSCKLKFVEEGGTNLLDGINMFLLADDELDGVEGPLPDGETGNLRLDGKQMRLASPSLIDRLISRKVDGGATLSHWPAGRYTLRSFPDLVAFDPPTIELTPDMNDVTIRVKATQ